MNQAATAATLTGYLVDTEQSIAKPVCIENSLESLDITTFVSA